MDGQARRSGTRRRRRWCNRGLVGLHAQVSAVAPNAPTDLPGSDSIRRPREGRLAARLTVPPYRRFLERLQTPGPQFLNSKLAPRDSTRTSRWANAAVGTSPSCRSVSSMS